MIYETPQNPSCSLLRQPREPALSDDKRPLGSDSMASNGQRQTLEQNETNEGLSVPDTWEQMPRDEDPATAREGLRLNADALRKALDGLRLTPTPGESPTATSPATPDVQETVSRSSFTTFTTSNSPRGRRARAA